MKFKTILVLIAVALLIFVGYESLFVVNQTQQALVLQFGEPKRVITEPGLKVKLPFVQNVVYLDKWILDFEPESPQENILGDGKRIVVDSITRYRIEDPLLYYQRVRNETILRSRLAGIIDSTQRLILGRYSLSNLLSDNRATIMHEIKDLASEKAKEIGIEILDVRIGRADLPEQNTQAVLQRMKTERERISRQIRASGREESQKIRADADKTQRVILAEAERQSLETRGQGDRLASTLYAEAFGLDPAFFAFYRSMEAYKSALADESTSLVISPNNDFFRYFNDRQAPPQAASASKAAVNEQEIIRRLGKIKEIFGTLSEQQKKQPIEPVIPPEAVPTPSESPTPLTVPEPENQPQPEPQSTPQPGQP